MRKAARKLKENQVCPPSDEVARPATEVHTSASRKRGPVSAVRSTSFLPSVILYAHLTETSMTTNSVPISSSAK